MIDTLASGKDTLASGKVSMIVSRALSSTLATLGLLQPQALGFLNRVDPSDSASNYYLSLLVIGCILECGLDKELFLHFYFFHLMNCGLNLRKRGS